VRRGRSRRSWWRPWDNAAGDEGELVDGGVVMAGKAARGRRVVPGHRSTSRAENGVGRRRAAGTFCDLLRPRLKSREAVCGAAWSPCLFSGSKGNIRALPECEEEEPGGNADRTFTNSLQQNFIFSPQGEWASAESAGPFIVELSPEKGVEGCPGSISRRTGGEPTPLTNGAGSRFTSVSHPWKGAGERRDPRTLRREAAPSFGYMFEWSNCTGTPGTPRRGECG